MTVLWKQGRRDALQGFRIVRLGLNPDRNALYQRINLRAQRMLKQITAVISDTKTNIRNIEARTNNGQANVDIVLDIADLKHLENIVNGVRKIPGVHDVQRLQKI